MCAALGTTGLECCSCIAAFQAMRKIQFLRQQECCVCLHLRGGVFSVPKRSLRHSYQVNTLLIFKKMEAKSLYSINGKQIAEDIHTNRSVHWSPIITYESQRRQTDYKLSSEYLWKVQYNDITFLSLSKYFLTGFIKVIGHPIRAVHSKVKR